MLDLNKIKLIKIVHPNLDSQDSKSNLTKNNNNQIQTLSEALNKNNNLDVNKNQVNSSTIQKENARKEFFKLFHKTKKQHSNNLNNSQLIVDSNGILHLNLKQVNDIMAESIVGEDKRVYLNQKIAQKYGLLNPDIKQVEVENKLIPVQELTKQEVKKIQHDEKVKKHALKKKKK